MKRSHRKASVPAIHYEYPLAAIVRGYFVIFFELERTTMTNSKYANGAARHSAWATAVLATLVAGGLTMSAARADAGGNATAMANAYGNWTNNPNSPPTIIPGARRAADPGDEKGDDD